MVAAEQRLMEREAATVDEEKAPAPEISIPDFDEADLKDLPSCAELEAELDALQLTLDAQEPISELTRRREREDMTEVLSATQRKKEPDSHLFLTSVSIAEADVVARERGSQYPNYDYELQLKKEEEAARPKDAKQKAAPASNSSAPLSTGSRRRDKKGGDKKSGRPQSEESSVKLPGLKASTRQSRSAGIDSILNELDGL